MARDPLGVLVFVEVKSRWSLNGGRPSAQVHAKKQFRVWRAARAWVARSRVSPDQAMRFDVICLSFRDSKPEIQWLSDAFMGPSSGY